MPDVTTLSAASVVSTTDDEYRPMGSSPRFASSNNDAITYTQSCYCNSTDHHKRIATSLKNRSVPTTLHRKRIIKSLKNCSVPTALRQEMHVCDAAQDGTRDMHQPTRQSLLKHRGKTSYCLLYTTLALGFLSFLSMDFFIRVENGKSLLHKNNLAKDDFITWSGSRDVYAPGMTKRLRRSFRREHYEATEPFMNEEVNSMPASAGSSMNFAKVPTYRQGIGSWPLDPVLYINEDTSSTRERHAREFYFDETIKYHKKKTSEVDIYAQPQHVSNTTDGGSGSETIPQKEGECVPMNEWQTKSYPTCNKIHEIDLLMESHLFGVNGFWRNAWKVENASSKCNDSVKAKVRQRKETVVLKTLKYEHSFEADQYERSRVDAVIMEHLTKSPHVIDAFGACGNSVLTEFADGDRVGTLADKQKKNPLARLKIARDVAIGLADLHGIDGGEVASFVHFDINLANVVSIGGRLKLNDFNVGVMMQKNITSEKACGFPAKYSNPQWRSPEEANGSQFLSEKVDVWSLGHIFFRLICLNEPWHKLEPGYVKGGEIRKDYVNEQVKRGILPTIPKEVMNTSDAEVLVIREAMLACYNFVPKQRPSARDIANFLNKGLEELSQHALRRRPGKDHWGSFRLGKKK